MDHEVRLSTTNLLVAGIDLEFKVKMDGGLRGVLSVSEGGLHWKPARKRTGIDITWSEFAKWAES